MVAFDAAHAAAHYPADRRFRIWLKPSLLLVILTAIVLRVIAAWIQVDIVGLPTIAPVAHGNPSNIPSPFGFPLWVRYCQFFNFLLVTMLVCTGLSIVADHPRLYFNDACTPGGEWVRFTPLVVPRDRLWTAKDDARYLSPPIGTAPLRLRVENQLGYKMVK